MKTTIKTLAGPYNSKLKNSVLFTAWYTVVFMLALLKESNLHQHSIPSLTILCILVTLPIENLLIFERRK